MLIRVMTLGVLTIAGQGKADTAWEFPNFADRIQITVENPQDAEYDGVAIMKLAELRQRDPKFPGRLLLAVEDQSPVRWLATQMDLADGELAVEVHLSPREKKPISVYYSTTLRDQVPVVPRVYSSHNYGYNHATAAIESELAGYRTYGGFFLDVQSHAKGERGLFNTMFGYSSISHPPSEGEDVIHLGDTLGLGGIFLRAGDAVYRPPVSTPDYAHRAAKAGEPEYDVISTGPLRAIIQESLGDWVIGADHVSLKARYEMDAGQEVVHCHWWLTPRSISRNYEVGAGIRELESGHVSGGPNVLITDGVQDASVGRIALGLGSGEGAKRGEPLRTPEGENEVVVFQRRLTASQPIEGEYTVAAAWQGSGWNDPAAHVNDMLRSQSGAVRVQIGSHTTNPNPRALEGEPK